MAANQDSFYDLTYLEESEETKDLIDKQDPFYDLTYLEDERYVNPSDPSENKINTVKLYGKSILEELVA